MRISVLVAAMVVALPGIAHELGRHGASAPVARAATVDHRRELREVMRHGRAKVRTTP